MIIKKNLFNKLQSEYECDMCKVKLFGAERISVHIALGSNNPRKKWDLCKRCYRKVGNAIENWHIKKGEQKKCNT